MKSIELNIIEIKNPSEDYYTIKLEKPEYMHWEAGQHGIFTIPEFEISDRQHRVFSMASTPDENFVLLGTRTGNKVSSFKKVLLSLKQGDKLHYEGPYGEFIITDTSRPVILIAGGVGITPIRALIKKFESENLSAKIIYSSSGFYLFGDELGTITNNNTLMQLDLCRNRNESTNLITSSANELSNSGIYYISGAVKFIESIKDLLIDNGIDEENILNDPFVGY